MFPVKKKLFHGTLVPQLNVLASPQVEVVEANPVLKQAEGTNCLPKGHSSHETSIIFSHCKHSLDAEW